MRRYLIDIILVVAATTIIITALMYPILHEPKPIIITTDER